MRREGLTLPRRFFCFLFLFIICSWPWLYQLPLSYSARDLLWLQQVWVANPTRCCHPFAVLSQVCEKSLLSPPINKKSNTKHVWAFFFYISNFPQTFGGLVNVVFLYAPAEVLIKPLLYGIFCLIEASVSSREGFTGDTKGTQNTQQPELVTLTGKLQWWTENSRELLEAAVSGDGKTRGGLLAAAASGCQEGSRGLLILAPGM